MMSKRKIVIIRVVLLLSVVFVGVVIFCLSADNAEASNAKSEVFSDSLSYRILSSFSLTPEQIEKVLAVCTFVVRKFAHFSEYAVLGFLLASVCISFYKSKKFTYITAQITASAYAASDEIHQLFVPGRSGQIRDVFIDSVGALVGIAALFLILCIYGSLKKRRNKKKQEKRRIASIYKADKES